MSSHTWFNNKSWDPTLLTDSRPQPDVEPVEPERATQEAETEKETEPGTIAWLYRDYGGSE